MRGGPFVDVPATRRGEIRELMATMVDRCAALLELADAIDAVEALVRTTDGASLDDLYARVPPALRGLVELQYDLNDQASLRRMKFLEEHY